MLRKCLLELKERNLEIPFLNKNINYLLETFDDDQLLYLLQNGVKLDNEHIILQYFYGAGFRCFNENYEYVGRKPICNLIEKKLNESLSNKE